MPTELKNSLRKKSLNYRDYVLNNWEAYCAHRENFEKFCRNKLFFLTNEHQLVIFLSYCQNHGARRAAHRRLLKLRRDNRYYYNSPRELARQLLASRHRESELSSHKNYFTQQLSKKAEKSSGKIYKFLRDYGSYLSQRHAAREQEFQQWVLRQQKKFEPWDSLYWRRKFDFEQFGHVEAEFEEYFELQASVAKIVQLAEKLFNVKFKKVSEAEPPYFLSYLVQEPRTKNYFSCLRFYVTRPCGRPTAAPDI